jgi:hypothetical protein
MILVENTVIFDTGFIFLRLDTLQLCIRKPKSENVRHLLFKNGHNSLTAYFIYLNYVNRELWYS